MSGRKLNFAHKCMLGKQCPLKMKHLLRGTLSGDDEVVGPLVSRAKSSIIDDSDGYSNVVASSLNFIRNCKKKKENVIKSLHFSCGQLRGR